MKVGKFELDGFCSLEHKQDTKDAVPEKSYTKHVEKFKEALLNKTYIPTFNEKVRPAFASLIIACKKKQQVQYATDATIELTSDAQQAWEETNAALDSETAQALDAKEKELLQVRKSIKRKESTPKVSILVDSQELLSPEQSPATKKPKVEVKPEPEQHAPENAEPAAEDAEPELKYDDNGYWDAQGNYHLFQDNPAYDEEAQDADAQNAEGAQNAEAQAGPSTSAAPIPPAAAVPNASRVQFAKAVLTPLPDNGDDMDLN